jgi:hypothetical protein
MRGEDFMAFFERSTRLLERALNQPYDFAVDYSARGDDERCVSFVGNDVSIHRACSARGDDEKCVSFVGNDGSIHRALKMIGGFRRKPNYYRVCQTHPGRHYLPPQ